MAIPSINVYMVVFPETVLPGVCSSRVVRVHPRIKVCLLLLNVGVDFLSECDSIELILQVLLNLSHIPFACGLFALILE